MDLGFDVVVTITGIVLVFLILVLLMAIITLEGLGATRLISFLSCRIGRHSPTIASICGPSCPQLKSAEECD